MRLPRKLKKKAKKLRDRHHAIVASQIAITTAMGLSRVAIISSIPFQHVAQKALSAASACYDTAQAVSRLASEMKPYTYYANQRR